MDNPFVCDAGVDKPGIIGARWWNSSLKEWSILTPRRAAMKQLAITVGVLALAGGAVYAMASAASDDDGEEAREEKRKSVDMQRDYGWNFGATSETVAFDAQYTQKYARQALKTLEQDMASGTAHDVHYVRTLFESPEAVPRLTLPDGEQARVKPLAEALRPIRTPQMDLAKGRGRALGALLAQATMPVIAIVDMAGEEAVAFAAGASSSLAPVFLFDNWPHPRGVVPSHRTLAAAVYYQPVFANAKSARPKSAPPLFVLEHARLAKYTDNATQFDNRYVCKLPASVAKSGSKVLYIVGTQNDVPEPDDLNTMFVSWIKSGVEVRALAASSFIAKPALDGGEETFLYGGDEKTHAAFFGAYPWKAPTPAREDVSSNSATERYRPVASPTASSLDVATIGTAAVMIGLASGLVLGSKLNRNGSWNRASSSYGGG